MLPGEQRSNANHSNNQKWDLLLRSSAQDDRPGCQDKTRPGFDGRESQDLVSLHTIHDLRNGEVSTVIQAIFLVSERCQNAFK